MSNLEEGFRWLAQVEADLKTAKGCLNNEDYYASAFFCQQAAEKSLEGFLYSKGYRALLTPSTLELIEKVSEEEKKFYLL